MTTHQRDYREIITKAVCGNGKKFIQSKDEVMSNHHPSSILGCWIINHEYHARKQTGNIVQIEGHYDINIWYAFQDNSKTEVVREQIHYCDDIPLTEVDEHAFDHIHEVMAKVVKQPNCMECSIVDGRKIHVEVEREFAVEVIGETKVRVKVTPIPVKNNPSQSAVVKRVK